MFNDECGLTKAAKQGYKETTRRAEKKLHKFINEYEQKHEIPFEVRKCEIVAGTDGGLGWLHIETADSCEVVPTQYKVGEIVAVAQCYESIHDEMMSGDFCNGIYDAFRNAMVAGTPGWSNKMFVRADLMPSHIKILNMRLERLQDITNDDCLKEGVTKYRSIVGYHAEYVIQCNTSKSQFYHTPRKAFAALIDKVSGKGVWKSNPWVVVYEFEVVDYEND